VGGDLTALIERHVVSSLLKQHRLERLVGEHPTWSVDLDAGRLDVGGHHFRVDVVGTESHRAGTFVWGWANPSFAELHVMSAALLRALGARWGIEELTDADEIPLATLDGATAGLIAAGEADAAGHWVAAHGDGAVVFLVRGPALVSLPWEANELASALTELVTGFPGIDQRRAVEEFANACEPDFVLATGDHAGLRFDAPGGTVAVRFDSRRRIADVRGELTAVAVAPPHAPDADDDDDPLVVGRLPEGCPYVVLCDPFTLMAERPVAALPGPLPGSRRDVGIWLAGDPSGGERVESAGLLLSESKPVDWQTVGSVAVDSGVACLGTPEAVARFTAGGEPALETLDRLLTAATRTTWTHAAGDLVVFSTGYGDGEHDVLFGYDADDLLTCVAVGCVPPPVDVAAPGRCLEIGFLLPAASGGESLAENVIPLPPAANRATTRFARRLLRAAADGAEVVAELLPEYDDDSPVPARLRYRTAVDGGRWSAEVVDIAPPPL
jgi:hypothetical protein